MTGALIICYERRCYILNVVGFFRAVFLVLRIGEDAVIRDGLTGLYRREEALRRGSKAIRKALKKGQKVSVVIIDSDDMKHTNDSEGHDAGDLLLKKLGTLILDGSRNGNAERESDICGRYGGDEFIVIMPGSSVDGADLFIDRTRKKADEAGVRFSYGIAEVMSGVTFQAAIKIADNAMYKDKRSRKGGGDH